MDTDVDVPDTTSFTGGSVVDVVVLPLPVPGTTVVEVADVFFDEEDELFCDED